MSDCRTDSLMFELKGFDPVRDDGASWEMMLRWRQSWFKDRVLPWGVEDGIWVFKNPSIFLENKIKGHTFKMTIENVEKKKICCFRVPIFNFQKSQIGTLYVRLQNNFVPKEHSFWLAGEKSKIKRIDFVDGRTTSWHTFWFAWPLFSQLLVYQLLL